MTEREGAVNQDLRALDEAHRLGRISRAEYRARRRRVLESLFDSSNVVTARKALAPSGAITMPRAGGHPGGDAQMMSSAALTTLLSMRPGIGWRYVLLCGVAGVLVLALGYWLLLGR